MAISTELGGSLPQSAKLQTAVTDHDNGGISREQCAPMEATGSPTVPDGEPRASSVATYPLTDTLAGTGLAESLAGDGRYFLEQARASTQLGF